MIRFAAITPHPPIIIPTIGRSNLNLSRKTVNAMKAAGEKFRSVKANTIVLISPHGPVQYDKFIINYSPTLRGDLSSFAGLFSKMTANSLTRLWKVAGWPDCRLA